MTHADIFTVPVYDSPLERRSSSVHRQGSPDHLLLVLMVLRRGRMQKCSLVGASVVLSYNVEYAKNTGLRSSKMPVNAQKGKHGLCAVSVDLVQQEATNQRKRRRLPVSAVFAGELTQRDFEDLRNSTSVEDEFPGGPCTHASGNAGEREIDPHNLSVTLDALANTWCVPLRQQAGLTVGEGNTGQQEAQGSSPAFKGNRTRDTGSKLSDRSHLASCGLLELWAFCVHVANKGQDPRDALQPVGLKLIGPFDLLAEDCGAEQSLAGRGRHFYDIPECLPVLQSSGVCSSGSRFPSFAWLEEGYHMCLFRDREEQVPHAVVSNNPSVGPEFKVVCADVSLSSVRTSVSSGRLPGTSSAGLSVEGVGTTKQEEPRTKISRKGLKDEETKSDAIHALDDEATPRIPLLVAAVLLHCEQVMKSCKEEPASVSKARLPRNATRTNQGAASATKSPQEDGTSAKKEKSHMGEAARVLRDVLLSWLRSCLRVTEVSVPQIEERTREWMRHRKKSIVCSDFSGLGVMVPYDPETDTGYRSLGYSETSLRAVIRKIKSAPKEERNMQPLDELFNLAGIAMDEGDVGAALELGRNLFLADSPNERGCRMIKPAQLLLQSAYGLLEQPHFAAVVDAMVAVRRVQAAP
ncbi:c4orf27-like protein [Cystoisospora suis]|uniref:C4orf27-like protein n=1 Tax=Cystoisospora suis TaxID=483139 RepID=A0A2C6KUK8_9APIC|nr:c4orf27-like protein [Cystoisospora suis]